jgi:hypothetical protein
MAITLKIGEPIKSKTPKDIFELKVEYMSGDADAYDTHTFIFKGLDDKGDSFKLSEALTILIAYDKATKEKWNAVCGITATELSSVLAIDEEIIDSANDAYFFPGDVTCDHQYMAMIDSYELFYWDVNGIKHDVIVEEK